MVKQKTCEGLKSGSVNEVSVICLTVSAEVLAVIVKVSAGPPVGFTGTYTHSLEDNEVSMRSLYLTKAPKSPKMCVHAGWKLGFIPEDFFSFQPHRGRRDELPLPLFLLHNHFSDYPRNTHTPLKKM